MQRRDLSNKQFHFFAWKGFFFFLGGGVGGIMGGRACGGREESYVLPPCPIFNT